ncbi:recombinase family protein [Streptomyces thermolilacinus]|uniref:recombinase family protein n=1 Tax=Streptomyces thermolilacinus TaxID=285540 RepID=UPI0033E2954B
MSLETFAGQARGGRSLAGLRGGLYARKSAYRGKVANKGRSVREQLDAGQANADGLGVNVVEQFIDDDRSASTYRAREREEFERMIEWIEAKKLDIVFAWASTRLQRDIAVYARLRDACAANGVLWCYGGKVYDLSDKDDRFRTGLDALLGEREVDEMRDNVLRSLRANAVNGLPHGQRAYGYRRVYDPHTRALVRTEKEPAEAKVVAEICRRVAAGEAYAQIALSLNMRGVVPPARDWRKEQIKRLAEWREDLPENTKVHPDWVRRIKDHAELRAEARERLAAGEPPLDVARDFNERDEPLLLARWHAATIVDYASDPRYLGSRTHHGKVTAEDAWPRIVAKATHVRCLAIIAERKSKKHNSRPGKAVNWLSGSMQCDVCEVPVGSGRNAYGPYYRCVQPGVEGVHEGKGYHVSAMTGPVDAHVEGELFEWLSSPAFVAAFTQDDAAAAQQVEEAEAEVKLLKERLKGFQDKAIAGELSAESLAAVEVGLLPKIKEAEGKARALQAPSVVRDLVGATPAEVAAAWAGLALSQRRLVAETLLDVRLRKAPRGVVLPMEERLVVRPRRPAQQKLVKAA